MLVSEVNILRELKHPNIGALPQSSSIPLLITSTCAFVQRLRRLNVRSAQMTRIIAVRYYDRIINRETSKIYIVME